MGATETRRFTSGYEPNERGVVLSREDLLAELEDYVKDCIRVGSADPVLAIIIDLTLEAERQKRPLFSDALKEPYFFGKYVKRWILEGIEESAAINVKQKELLASMSK